MGSGWRGGNRDFSRFRRALSGAFGRARLATIFFLLTLAATARSNPPNLEPEQRAPGLWTCRVDLDRERLRGFYTDQFGERFGSMTRLEGWLNASGEQIDCAVNGGIFGVDLAPLGLFVADGVLLHPLNVIRNRPGNFFLEPNGALIIRRGKARISSTDSLLGEPLEEFGDVDLAVQSGPLLVQSGRVSARLDPQSRSYFTRDAVCVSDPSHVVLAYSAIPQSLYQFAAALLAIGCVDALYLDGHLSQMYPSGENLSAAQRQDLSTMIGITSRMKP